MLQHERLLQLLHQWQMSELGQAVHAAEQHALNKLLPQVFGYHLLQVSIADQQYNLSASPIRERIFINHDTQPPRRVPTARALSGELPFADNSVDLVILPHVLEYIDNPHMILREACRVIVPEGYMIILSHNPYSLWGLAKILKRKQQQAVPWQGRFIGATTMQNWLTAYDFAINQRHNIFYRPPFQHAERLAQSEWWERLGSKYWSPCGGVYVLFAQKRMLAVRPIRVSWKASSKMRTGGIIETMQQKVKNDN